MKYAGGHAKSVTESPRQAGRSAGRGRPGKTGPERAADTGKGRRIPCTGPFPSLRESDAFYRSLSDSAHSPAGASSTSKLSPGRTTPPFSMRQKTPFFGMMQVPTCWRMSQP